MAAEEGGEEEVLVVCCRVFGTAGGSWGDALESCVCGVADEQ